MLELKNATRGNVNAMLRDGDISLRAKGLLSLLVNGLDNPSLETIGNASKDGTGSMRSAIMELEESGYLVRERMRDDHGRLTQYRWIVDLKRYK